MPGLHSQRVYVQCFISSAQHLAEKANGSWGICSKFFKTKHFLNEKSGILIGCRARGFVLKNAIDRPSGHTNMLNSPAQDLILQIFEKWVEILGV